MPGQLASRKYIEKQAFKQSAIRSGALQRDAAHFPYVTPLLFDEIVEQQVMLISDV